MILLFGYVGMAGLCLLRLIQGMAVGGEMVGTGVCGVALSKLLGYLGPSLVWLMFLTPSII